MPRTPKGVYARNTPDWFTYNWAWGSGQLSALSPTGGSVSLFNDDTQGRYLHVYGLALAVADQQQMYGQVLQGSLGTKFQSCYPVRADQPQPPGSIWTGPLPASFDFIHVPLTFQGTQPMDPWFTAWPIAIVPAGYCFALWNTGAQIAALATFWYVFLNEA